MDDRLIVAQPRVNGDAPLTAGVVRFRARFGDDNLWQLALVVKVAFSFAPGADGRPPAVAELVPAPPPSLDVASELPGAADGELAYPSDFVPRKKAVDVLATGHAYAEQPSHRIEVSIAVGDVRRVVTVAAGGPAASLPLSSAYVRAADGVSPTRPLGPIAVAAPLDEHPDDFDFVAYASAAPSQHAASIPAGASIELVGLSPHARSRFVELPGIVPAACVVMDRQADVPVELSCDTLWIDTDDELVVLVYRGAFPLESRDATEGIERIDLWLERAGAPRDVAAVRRELQRGAFVYATEASDLEHGEGPPDLEPERLAAVKYALWGESPAPAMPLERYARISAELMEKRESRGDTLLRHELSEDDWSLEERAWLEHMGAAAMRGDALPAKQYGDLVLKAQEALAGPGEAARTLDDYVPIKAAMDRGADPSKVLAAFAMTLPEWMRLDRRFAAAASRDAALRDEIERRVKAEQVDPRLLDDEADLALDDEDDDEEDA